MGIIARFADELQRRGVAMAGPPRPGDPNKFEPDALFDTPDGATLGIETTAGHYSREEAKWLWDVLRGQPERSPRWMRPGEDPREHRLPRQPEEALARPSPHDRRPAPT